MPQSYTSFLDDLFFPTQSYPIGVCVADDLFQSISLEPSPAIVDLLMAVYYFLNWNINRIIGQKATMTTNY